MNAIRFYRCEVCDIYSPYVICSVKCLKSNRCKYCASYTKKNFCDKTCAINYDAYGGNIKGSN